MARPLKPIGLMAYLTVNDGAAALAFYRDAFGARIVKQHVNDEDGRLIHSHLKIGSNGFMLSDQVVEINNRKFTANKDEKRAIIMQWSFESHFDLDGFLENALQAGCELIFPVENMYWGEFYGEILDPFGYVWSMVAPSGKETKVNFM